jgi:hypothetical protein
MISADRSQWPLTPSQQAQHDAIRAALTRLHGRQRPFLLAGEVGVGKTFLARRLAAAPNDCYDIARDHLPELLSDYSLTDLTPEAAVRFVKRLVAHDQGPWAIVDGLEPLLSLWAVECPAVSSRWGAPFWNCRCLRWCAPRHLIFLLRRCAHRDGGRRSAVFAWN